MLHKQVLLRPHKAPGQSSKTILDVPSAYKPLASSKFI